MTTHTCDKCGAAIDRNMRFQVGMGFAYMAEFCDECAKPFVALLTEANLLQEPLERYGFVEKAGQVSGAESRTH